MRDRNPPPVGPADASPILTSTEILDTPQAGPLVIRGGLLRAAAYGASILLSVASVPLMTRHLGVVDFGRYVTVTSLIFIVSGVTEAGLTNIGVREYSVRTGADRDSMMRNLLGLRIVLGAAGIAVGVLFGVIAGYQGVMVVGTLLAGAGLLIWVVQSTYTVPLAPMLRFGWLSGLELLRQAVAVAAILALVVAGASLLPFFVNTIAASLAALAAAVVLMRRHVPLRPAFERVQWSALIRDTLAYSVAAAIGIVYFRVAIVLMSVVSSDQQTGYFSASFRIIDVIAGVPWLLTSSAFPVLARAARDDSQRLRYALQRLFEVAAIAGVGAALLTAIGAPVAIDVVAGDKFEPSVDVLRIGAVTLVASFLLSTWSLALLSLRRHRALLLANGIALSLAIVLSIVMGSAYGARGGAGAMAITEAVLACLYGAMLMRQRADLRVSMSVLPRVAVAAAVAGAVGLALPGPNILAVAVAAVAYAGTLLMTRAVPRELFDALRR